jgi:hypothetical protein
MQWFGTIAMESTLANTNWYPIMRRLRHAGRPGHTAAPDTFSITICCPKGRKVRRKNPPGDVRRAARSERHNHRIGRLARFTAANGAAQLIDNAAAKQKAAIPFAEA